MRDKDTVAMVADFVAVTFQRCYAVPVVHIVSDEHLRRVTGAGRDM